MKPQKSPAKRHQPWSWKPSYKKPNKSPLSRSERKIKNNILGVIVKRVINDKAGSKNNKMAYGYYPKLLKE